MRLMNLGIEGLRNWGTENQEIGELKSHGSEELGNDALN
jgi:hypothetical protein